jgi:hypothetical protein
MTTTTTYGYLQAGDVIFIKGRGFLAWLNRFAQGNTDAGHVCLYVGNGKIHTTGANGLLWYGEVDAAKYLEGKEWEVRRWPGGLTTTQVEQVLEWSFSLFGGRYPIGKLLLMFAYKFRGEQIDQVAGPGNGKGMICGGAVAYCLDGAGLEVLKRLEKTDYDAVTPEDLWYLLAPVV